MFVIVLGGMARVGKTEAADILEELAIENGMFPKRISFAQPLKEAAADAAGYGKDWRKFKDEKPEEYRNTCQSLGQAARDLDPDHWVNLWKEALHAEMKTELGRDRGLKTWRETVVIVDDCRYENELTAAKDFDHCSLFIAAGDRRIPDIDADWRTHESERLAMLTEAGEEEYESLWEWFIFNEGDEDQLFDKLEDRASKLLGFHVSRLMPSCSCPECMAERADVRPSEVISSLKRVLDNLLADPSVSKDDRESLRKAFDGIIVDVASNKLGVKDFFSGAWLNRLESEYGIDLSKFDDGGLLDDEED